MKIKFLIKNYRTSSKHHLEVTKILDEIIIGSLLGDLTAEKRNINSNTRLQFKQSEIYKEYIFHLYELFKDYTGSPPIILSKFDKRPNKMKIYKAIKFQTLSLPCFNYYKEIFYNSENKKIVPINISEILTTRGLAYWLMDDGYKYKNGFYICTESFSNEDLLLLIQVLKYKFNLECSIHKHSNGQRIYILSSSKSKLINLISPYFLPVFNYKFI